MQTYDFIANSSEINSWNWSTEASYLMSWFLCSMSEFEETKKMTFTQSIYQAHKSFLWQAEGWIS